MPTRRLFGLPVTAFDFAGAVDSITQACQASTPDAGGPAPGRARVVVTPNVDHIVRLEKDPTLKQVYAQADYIFADGMPVVWASRLLGKPLPGRVTGSDLFVALCHQAVRHGWPVALIGGRPGQEQALSERFGTYYPGLKIDVICPSMAFEPLGDEGQRVAEHIRATQPALVFVCLGLPKQERWALHYASAFPAGVLMCVGAAMEFAIGLQSRAPRWVQQAGMEWLWRLLSNPRRLWRRYLKDDPYFLVLCWREWRQRRDARKDPRVGEAK